MKKLINGKFLVLLCSLPVIFITTFLVVQPAEFSAGLSLGMAFTARYSLVFFSITFIASSLQLLPKHNFINWIRKNRRYLGLSFAVSHLIHGLTITIFYFKYPALFQQSVSSTSKIFGGLGFFIIFIMALTSSDMAIKKIGHSRWKFMHRYGSYYLWIVFLVSYVGRATSSVVYSLVVAFLISCVGLRVVHSRKVSRQALN